MQKLRKDWYAFKPLRTATLGEKETEIEGVAVDHPQLLAQTKSTTRLSVIKGQRHEIFFVLFSSLISSSMQAFNFRMKIL